VLYIFLLNNETYDCNHGLNEQWYKFLKVNEMDYVHSLQNGTMTRKTQYAHSLQNGAMTRKVQYACSLHN